MECTLKCLGFLSTQLWRVGFCCPNRSKYAVMRLGATLERTGFCSYCVGLCSSPTRRGGWVVSMSAYQSRDAGSILSSRCIFLSFFLRGLVTKVRLRTPLTNVFSVAEWLALLLCYVASDGVETRLGFAVHIRSANKCRGQPHKTREGCLETGRMGITSPATEPLRRPTQPHSDELRVRR